MEILYLPKGREGQLLIDLSLLETLNLSQILNYLLLSTQRSFIFSLKFIHN